MGLLVTPTPKTRTPLSYDSYSKGSSSSGVGCPDPLTSLQSGSEILAEEWCWERCYSHPLNPLKTESEKAPNEGMCGIEVGGTLNRGRAVRAGTKASHTLVSLPLLRGRGRPSED